MTRHGDQRRWWSFARRFLLAGMLALVIGCSGKSPVNPQLLLPDDPDKIQQAVDRGKKYWGQDPYVLYSKTTQTMSTRVSQNVILRSAAICRPLDELAFQIATLPADSGDDAVKQATGKAEQLIGQQAKFVVTLQLTQTYDPTKVQFELRANGTNYPPSAVPQPQLIANIPPSIDGDIPAAAVYGYDIYFQTTGSPGYPALGDTVSGLTLAIRAEEAEATVPFTLTSYGY